MKTLCIMLLFSIIGCKTNQGSDRICDSDFNVFFKKFEGDSVFQKSHVDFPIIEYYSGQDFPLDLMERMTNEGDYAFIDFTDDKSRYEISIQQKKDSVFYIRTWRESDGAMTYTFVNKNNCWKLVTIHDITD